MPGVFIFQSSDAVLCGFVPMHLIGWMPGVLIFQASDTFYTIMGRKDYDAGCLNSQSPDTLMSYGKNSQWRKCSASQSLSGKSPELFPLIFPEIKRYNPI